MNDRVLMIDEMREKGSLFRMDYADADALKFHAAKHIFDGTNLLTAFRQSVNEIEENLLFNIMPPFPEMWLEFNTAGVTEDEVCLSNGHGAFIFTTPYKDYAPRIAYNSNSRQGVHHVPPIRIFKDVAPGDDIMVITFVCVIRRIDTGEFDTIGRASVLIDNKGKPISRVTEEYTYPIEWENGTDTKLIKQTLIFLFALQLMNCKNVSLQENTPSDKFRKARFKRHGVEPVKYHTIRIDPFGAAKHTGDSTGNGFKKSLHICRGHFSTYTPEKPLFGKYSGTYWIPAHVKGDREIGVVKSRYDFKPVVTGDNNAIPSNV